MGFPPKGPKTPLWVDQELSGHAEKNCCADPELMAGAAGMTLWWILQGLGRTSLPMFWPVVMPRELFGGGSIWVWKVCFTLVVLGTVKTGSVLFGRIRFQPAEVRDDYNYWRELCDCLVTLGLLLAWT